jgi:hypothetical protein
MPKIGEYKFFYFLIFCSLYYSQHFEKKSGVLGLLFEILRVEHVSDPNFLFRTYDIDVIQNDSAVSIYGVPSEEKFSKTYAEGFLRKRGTYFQNPPSRKIFVYQHITFKFHSLIVDYLC